MAGELDPAERSGKVNASVSAASARISDLMGAHKGKRESFADILGPQVKSIATEVKPAAKRGGLLGSIPFIGRCFRG